MQQFDYNKYLKNNPLLKESIDQMDAVKSQAMKILQDLQNELMSMKTSGNIPDGESVIDRALYILDNIDNEERDDENFEDTSYEKINEVTLDPVNQQLKDKYLQDYLTQILDDYASEYDDDLADLDTIEAHAEKFGYTDTLRTIDAKNDPKFSKRGIPHAGFDPLQSKVVGNYDNSNSAYRREPVITKKGKMHKYDTNFIKNKIKSDLGIDN